MIEEQEVLFKLNTKFKVEEVGYDYNPLEPWEPIRRIKHMENKSLLEKRLIELKKQEKLYYNLLKNFSFKTEWEAQKYIEKNKTSFDELKEIKEEIKELELQLMTPKEKQEYLEYQKKLKDKYSND